jgi:phage terminase Nu1 subunit (DNA packaging protein)
MCAFDQIQSFGFLFIFSWGLPVTNDGKTYLNKRKLSGFLDKSEPTIDKMIRNGMPLVQGGEKGVAYIFCVEDVVAWITAVEEAAAREAEEHDARVNQQQMELTGGTIAPPDIRKLPAAERIRALDAERKAIQLALDKGELLRRDAVMRDYAAIFSLLQQRLLGLPNALARTLSLGQSDQKIVATECRNLLTELSAQIADPDLRPAANVALTHAA